MRGYLRWKNIAYTEVLASLDVHKQVILPKVGWSVIPVITAPDGTTVQDTTDIIDYIETNEAHQPVPSVYPTGAKQKTAALILELLGDEFLIISAMHYRWNYNEDYAYGEFGKAMFPNLPAAEQLESGTKAGARFKGFLPFLGITPKSAPAIEVWYENFLSAFDTHLKNHDFLFGSRPSIGDYGLLGPLYAHNYRDPASGEIMKRTAPRVADWCLRIHAPQHPLTGGFLERDEIPDTLLPILKMFAQDQLPILLDTIAHLQAWHADNSDTEEVPRALGFHEYTLNGITENRGVIPYSLWMLQRVTDHLNTLGSADRSITEDLLISIGADALIDLEITPRLTRKNFKLAIA